MYIYMYTYVIYVHMCDVYNYTPKLTYLEHDHTLTTGPQPRLVSPARARSPSALQPNCDKAGGNPPKTWILP